MLATTVAAPLAFRARVTGTGRIKSDRIRRGACRDPKHRPNTRQAARAVASPAEAKTELKKKAKEETKKEVTKEETKSETTAKEPPPPPAAPAGYEKDILKLEKAGVAIHKFGTEYLDDGKNNDEVRELQRFLKGTGHYEYKDGVTGYFGPMTQTAVKKWQSKYGLAPSGGWGIQSRATYLQVKHAELRAMRDPEAAASWSKSAVANGLVNKNTGLPIPPSIGDSRAGEAKPAWVASANTGHTGSSTLAAKSHAAGMGNLQAYAVGAVLTALVLGRLFTRGDASDKNGDGDGWNARRGDNENETNLPGFAGDGEVVDVQALDKDDGDKR